MGSNGTAKRRAAALHSVQEYVNDLLFRIEEAIPLISLALTTSGANLSARMPDSVSPGRFLQAGNYLRKADEKFESLLDSCADPNSTPIRVQVGPTFALVLYTIFYGTMRNPHLASSSDITWKEEHARCQVRLWRVNDMGATSFKASSQKWNPPTFNDLLEYQYMMTIDESFKDGRYHDADEKPSTRLIDISTVTRLFFSASGKLLQIEESKSPVLVLKLNSAFDPLRNMSTTTMSKNSNSNDDSDTASDTDLSDPEEASFIYEQNHEHLAAAPEHVEWLAFEQYGVTENSIDDLDNSDDHAESSSEEEAEYNLSEESITAKGLSSELNSLRISDTTTQQQPSSSERSTRSPPATLGRHTDDRGSLSLLEYLVRISALQANDQDSIYNIHDERIALYLRDESATGDSSNSAPSSVKDSPVYNNKEDEKGLPRNRRRSNQTPGGSSIGKPRVGSSGGRKSSRHSSPYTPGASQFPPIPKTSASSRYGTNQEQQKQEQQTSTPLTPWEKDRLKTRRQLLLLRKGASKSQHLQSSDTPGNYEKTRAVDKNGPITRQTTRNLATTGSRSSWAASQRRSPYEGEEEGNEAGSEDDDRSLFLSESPLRMKSR